VIHLKRKVFEQKGLLCKEMYLDVHIILVYKANFKRISFDFFAY